MSNLAPAKIAVIKSLKVNFKQIIITFLLAIAATDWVFLLVRKQHVKRACLF